MKCIEIRKLLSLFIDQMLDESQLKEVEEHLSACDACRYEYNDLKGVHDQLSQVEMVPVPVSFEFRLKKALKEERQNMVDEGILVVSSKKKGRLRILTSIAAVFAVGVMSFGLYQDVLGILPDKIDGGEQSAAASTETTYGVKPSDIEDDGMALEDNSVIMKDEASDLQPNAKVENIEDLDDVQNFSSNTGTLEQEQESNADPEGMDTYGFLGSPEFDENQSGTTEDVEEEQISIAGTGGFDGDLSKNNKLESKENCSRSLTSSGVERNTAAVKYYDSLIKNKLEGFDYQILDSSYTQTGEWTFRVFIFRGKDGNTYNEEILVIGKDGEIEVICSNEFMGL